MDWVAVAEEYIGERGWGARGKYIGISRMYTDTDKTTIRKDKVVAAQRPRGILSGFLAVVPTLGYAVYLPPIAAKTGPQRFRLRLSEQVLTGGAIFSAYPNRAKQFVLEDVLHWQGESVWHTKPFKERWEKTLADFVSNHFKPMLELQETEIVLAKYISANQIQEPDSNNVIEFVLNNPNTKRIIWIPPKVEPAPIVQQQSTIPSTIPSTTSTPTLTPTATSAQLNVFKLKKETGPDVYSVWRGEERLGLALIKTLAISKALRLANIDEISVVADYSKQFDKWEIKTVVEQKKTQQ